MKKNTVSIIGFGISGTSLILTITSLFAFISKPIELIIMSIVGLIFGIIGVRNGSRLGIASIIISTIMLIVNIIDFIVIFKLPIPTIG